MCLGQHSPFGGWQACQICEAHELLFSPEALRDPQRTTMISPCEWRPIKTAPRDGTAVLLFHPAWDMLQVGVQDDDTEAWQNPCGDLLRTPTHWMALPSPPKSEEQFSEELKVG